MPWCSSCRPLTSGTSFIYALAFVCLASFLPAVAGFGSGKIPDAAYLKGKAWRHGDIDDVLEGLAKVAGQGGGAIIGAIASAFFNSGSGEDRGRSRGGKKFSGLDVKRVYFGNWLRDLSQVCDIAGFKAMTGESLVICIMTMGFLTFGYATREFQVTRERLSVYLLTEHIDNPKGYGEGEDPRKYDPRLRPRVDEERELEIDERNGMKKYIASDDEEFDTSTKCIRRTLRKCIQIGREARQENNEEKEHESFRLLGTALHTLEDFSAHSNWCELALQKLGHRQVFAHVGENVKVNSPDGPVPPLVTGTFAGADFCFSMLGEASDKLSSASIADLTAQMDEAQTQNKQSGGNKFEFIKSILSKLPIGGGGSGDATVDDDLDQINQKKAAFDLDGRIDDLAPEKLQQQLWDIFVTRDNLMRRIEELIEGVPGLGELLEKLSTALTQWIMITIDPYVRPILLQASSAIGEGSHAVISGNDQWTVFSDPNASDPTHSVLAKDHFSNILNDPAGNISVIIVKYTVNLIVDTWSNDEDPDRVIDQILEAIHHPSYANRRSQIQMQMIEYMQQWLNEMDADDREITLNSLTKDSIRNHRNQRKTTQDGPDPRISGGVPSHGHDHSSSGRYQTSSYSQEARPYESRPYGGNQSYAHAQEQPSYGRDNESGRNNYGSQTSYPTSHQAKSSRYDQDDHGRNDAHDVYSNQGRASGQNVYGGDLRQEQKYESSLGRSKYTANSEDQLFESRKQYGSSANQGYGTGGRQQHSAYQRDDNDEDRGSYNNSGNAHQNQARHHPRNQDESSYGVSTRYENSGNSEGFTSKSSFSQDNTQYGRRQPDADERNPYRQTENHERNPHRQSENDERKAYRQSANDERKTYRQSDNNDGFSGGFSSDNQRRDEVDEYAGRTSTYGSKPVGAYGGGIQEYGQSGYGGGGRDESHGHHQSDSHDSNRCDRYVKSRHHRQDSTDSGSSKGSDKKKHSKSKHKHKSKSKSRSRSRDRDDRGGYGRYGGSSANNSEQRDSDYGMNRLNMNESSRRAYNYD